MIGKSSSPASGAESPSGVLLYPSASNDPSVPHLHQVHTAHGVRLAVAEPETPTDGGPVSRHGDVLDIELAAAVRRERLPERQTRVAAFVSCAVWSWLE